MKPQKYAEHAIKVSKMKREGADDCESILIFIDGDVIINNEIDVQEMQKIWLSFGADVVISTEMSCWMGFMCTEKDLKLFYGKHIEKDQLGPEKASPSPFINSGAYMGKATALADIYLRSVHYPEFDMDDQKMVTEWLIGNGSWSIATDTTQKIFGSTLYAQPFSSPIAGRSVCPSLSIAMANFSCVSIPGSKFFPEQCCSNGDIDSSTQLRMFPMVEQGPHACAITRHSGMRSQSEGRPGMDNGALDQFWTPSFSRLEAMPLFWHGNGPGKTIWTALAKRARRCRGVKWTAAQGAEGPSTQLRSIQSGVYVRENAKQNAHNSSHASRTPSHDDDADLIVDFTYPADPLVNYAGNPARARTWWGAAVFGPVLFANSAITTFGFLSNGGRWMHFDLVDSNSLQERVDGGKQVIWRRLHERAILDKRDKHNKHDNVKIGRNQTTHTSRKSSMGSNT